jgi:hypothetical protein
VSAFGTITTAFQRLTSPSKDDPATAKLRADSYYSIIARAITQLPNNECEARQTLYDRARAALTSRLHGQDPSRVTRERHALELAIRRVEENAEENAKVREIMRPMDRSPSNTS